jgi:hypothetical protein
MTPRVIRRVGIHCPDDGEAVEIDLLMRPTGGPEAVLRCSARTECPPACHRSCRLGAECVLAVPRALFICPPGSGPPEEID